MANAHPLPVVFFRTEAGNEPVREWLKALSAKKRRILGEGLKTVAPGAQQQSQADEQMYQNSTNFSDRAVCGVHPCLLH